MKMREVLSCDQLRALKAPGEYFVACASATL